MTLTKDARKFLYHCLVMDDTNPNTLWRWDDDDLIRYYLQDCSGESIPEHWLEDADNGHNQACA